MSELTLPLRGAHYGSRFTDRGVSDDAQRLRSLLRTILDELLQTVSLGRGYAHAISDLDEAVREAEVDALALHEHSIALAVKFLEAFPTELAVPEVGVDPDGDIFFEWRFGARRRFNVAIQPSGTITYAGIVGTGRFHGREQFDDEIHPTILAAFRRTLEAARSGGA